MTVFSREPLEVPFAETQRPGLDHVVQFYESDRFLTDSVARFVCAGLGVGERAVIIATAEHQAAIERVLGQGILDYRQAVRDGMLVFLDAGETLAKFMVEGAPDAALFGQHVGAEVDRLGRSGVRVRAFGEMVAVLHEQGNTVGAVRLEELWNEWGRDRDMTLLCGYPIGDFDDGEQAESFKHICERHTHILPREGATGASAKAREQQLAILEQRARALDAEVLKRRAAEATRGLLAAIVDSSDDAIISKSLEGIVTSWNAGAARIFGYKAKEMIGRHISTLFPPARLVEEDEIIARLRKGERVDHYETVRLRKDGVPVDVSLTISPMRDASGHLVGASKIARDITERKRAEEQLAKQNERLELLNAAAGHLLAAEEGAEVVHALFNRVRAHLGVDCYFHYGVSENGNELVLQSCEGLDASAKNAIARLEFGAGISGRVAQELRPFVANAIHDSADPRVAPLRELGIRCYVSNPLMAGPRLLGTLAFGSKSRTSFQPDELEFMGTLCHYVSVALERIRLVRRLKEADRRKDEFLATLAHELRNPLAPIQTALELLRRQSQGCDKPDQLREIMERQVKQLVRLVDELLEISRITSGKIVLRPELVDLASVIRNAVDTSMPLIEKSEHRLGLSLPAERIIVDADPVRMAQVFANLMNNAAKYTDARGNIEVTLRREGGQAVVSVKDNGVGIPREMVPRVFDMFAQIDRTLNRAQGGLGIGLALAKRLVELHGGRIEARSEGPEKGSEFVVRMATAEEAGAAEGGADGAGAAEGTHKHRILIVDDNRDAAISLSMLLQTFQHRTRVAFDGLQAIKMAEEFRPDVVLLDIGMPHMDGYEVAKRLRSAKWASETKLLALTGWGQEEDRRRTKDAGFDHHFTKPIDIDALIQLLGD